MLNINLSQRNYQNPSKLNFGRALSPDERKISNVLMERTHQINGVDVRAIIVPGASQPSYTMTGKDGKPLVVDTGVGSPNSKAAREKMLFDRDIFGFNARQETPYGEISGVNLSPFSGSVFVRGAHLTDPGSIHEMGLVSREDVEKFNATERNNWHNNYNNYFDKNEEFFRTAHSNFTKKIETDSALRAQYDAFVSHPVYSQWLEKEAIGSVLKKHLYGNTVFTKWNQVPAKANPNCALELAGDVDKKLCYEMGSDSASDATKNRVSAIKADPACADEIEFFKFKQFLAYQQDAENYDFMTKNGIMRIADVPIGAEDMDAWSFPKAFSIDINTKKQTGIATLASPDGHGGTADWGVPALRADFASGHKDASEFVDLKYRNAIQTSDTARVDGGWQLRVQHVQNHFDDNTGSELIDLGDDGLFPAVKNAFDKAGKPQGLGYIVAENIGNDNRVQLTQNALNKFGMPQIALNWLECPTNYYGCPGTHDRPSIISRNPHRDNQINEFTSYFMGEKDGKGARKIMFMSPDVYGRSEQYNNPDNLGADNWGLREPENYQEFYYKQVSGVHGDEFGLNPYRVGKKAMEWKNIIGYENGNMVVHADANFAPDAKIVAELLEHFDGVLKEQKLFKPEEAEAQSTELMKGMHQKFGKEAVDILLSGYDSFANKPDNEGNFKKMMTAVAEAVGKHRVNNPQPVATVAQETIQNATTPTAPTTSATSDVKEVTSSAENASKEVGKIGKGKMAAIVGGVVAVGAVGMYLASQNKAHNIEKQRTQSQIYA